MSNTIKDITYLTPEERKRFKKSVEQMQEFLKTKHFSPYRAVRESDSESVKRRIVQEKRILEQRQAPIVQGREKDDRCKRLKILENRLKNGMPTKDEMMGIKITHGDGQTYHYEADPKIVDQNIQWTLKNEHLAREWKRIKRTLEPDNPEATDIEQIRNPH